MTAIVDIFSLLTAAAGWYYLFNSGAAQRLQSLEADRTNQKRVRLRRAGGVAMLMLGVLFFAGFQVDARTGMFLWIWIAVLALLAALVSLGLIDVRLTWKLRRDVRERRP